MAELGPSAARLHAEVEADVDRYRAVSGQAVAGLLLGLASPLALIAPLLWFVPAVGAGVSLLALRSIDGHIRIGRKAALVGLFLSLLFASASVSAQLSQGWFLAREARPVARLWFSLLADGEPHKAHQLTVPHRSRQPLDGTLWNYYRSSHDARESLNEFVDEPLVRTLLALGPQAKVRYWGTEAHGPHDNAQHIGQLYAVTYGDGAEKTTFFVRIALERSPDPETGGPRWKVLSFEGGVKPYGES